MPFSRESQWIGSNGNDRLLVSPRLPVLIEAEPNLFCLQRTLGLTIKEAQ